MTETGSTTAEQQAYDLLAPAAVLAIRTSKMAQDPKLLERLQAASDRFRDEVGYHVSQLIDDELLVDGSGGSLLYLGTAPVTAIASVTVNGQLIAPSAYRLMRRLGALEATAGIWPARADIAVVCTHGYAPGEIPRGIREAVLEQAEMGMNARIGVQSQTVLGDSVTFGASNIGVTAKWSRAVANYRQGHGDRA